MAWFTAATNMARIKASRATTPARRAPRRSGEGPSSTKLGAGSRPSQRRDGAALDRREDEVEEQRARARSGSAARGPSGSAARMSANAADRPSERSPSLPTTARPSGPGSPAAEGEQLEAIEALRGRGTRAARRGSGVEDHHARAVLAAHRARGEVPVVGAEEQRREDAERPRERAEDERDPEDDVERVHHHDGHAPRPDARERREQRHREAGLDGHRRAGHERGSTSSGGDRAPGRRAASPCDRRRARSGRRCRSSRPRPSCG